MQDAVRSSILSLNGREVDDRVRLLDAAYWMKRCSSLGKLRYAVLVGIGGSKKMPGEYALIDLKEAVDAVAPAAAYAEIPRTTPSAWSQERRPSHRTSASVSWPLAFWASPSSLAN